MKKLNIVSSELKVSIVLIDDKAVESGVGKVVLSNVSVGEYEDFANKRGFKIRKQDTTLAGFYFVDNKGNVLVSYPSFYKVGDTVKL